MRPEKERRVARGARRAQPERAPQVKVTAKPEHERHRRRVHMHAHQRRLVVDTLVREA